MQRPIQPTRRRFLLGTASVSAIAAAGVWRHAHKLPDGTPVLRRSAQALGAKVMITLAHADRRAGQAALDAAFAELEEIEEVMSLYRPNSQLSQLNARGVLDHPHPHLVTVLHAAAEISARSGGAFDATVQPLWELYRAAHERGHLPDADALFKTRSLIDWRRVIVSSQRVELHGQGTAVTLNGIAQGCATDAVMNILRKAGATHALIDAGELGALGSKPDGSAWRVGIRHPRQPGSYISLAKLKDRCLATSGDYETCFSDDFAHHHLFDPRTGHSPAECASVSIAAPTAMMADALSTAVFVLGPRAGLELVRSTPGADALIVQKAGSMEATAGFPLA